MRYVLGIDLGTSGTKTVLFDEYGNTISSSTVEYPLYQPKNGWAEQDPNDWWNAVKTTCKNVLSDSNVGKENVCSVGISGQMHGLVMLDSDNNVLRPSIIWCDQRTIEECKDIENAVGRERLIEITANPALTGFTASKILWVKKNEPEIYKKCAHILLPKDYIRFMLTGEYATEVSDASGMQLLDIKNRCWSDEVLEKLGIEKRLFGKVYESPEITGNVTSTAETETGILAGTPVVGGAGDNAAAAVGMGVVSDNSAFTTIGTSGVVYVHTDKMTVDKKGRVHTFCCAVPNAWHVMGVTQSAGLSLRWIKENFCEVEKNLAQSEHCDIYKIMDEEARKSKIGSDKLLFLPYLMGERTPHLNPNARGVFFGLSAIHTRYDIIRSVMEGVCFSLRDCLEVIKEMEISPDSMLACGGGGTSALWRQIMADVYNMEIKTVNSKEGPALGVAVLAMVGVGIYPSVETACKNIIKINKTTNPIVENYDRYEKFYGIYKSLYHRLKDEYDALAELE